MIVTHHPRHPIEKSGHRKPHFVHILCICVLALPMASAFYGQVSQDNARSNNSKIAIAEQKLEAHDFTGAVTLLSSLLQADSHSGSDAYRLLAFAEFKQSRIHEALSTCETGIVIYPESSRLTELYVSLLRDAFSDDDLLTRLEIAIKWAPDSPAIVKTLGEYLLAKNPTDPRALRFLSHASELSPRDPEAHFFYGEAACQSGMDEICIQELRRAHGADPNNEQANMQIFTMIAVTEDKENKPERAKVDFSLAIKANRLLPKPSPYAAMKFATFLIEQRQQKQAMEIVSEILQWDPFYGPAHFERAKFLFDEGKKVDAITEAGLALQSMENSQEQLRSYHYFLAKAYFALGRETDAKIHSQWIESHPQ